MTHTQLIYLILVVAAFLVFAGSLLIATITSLSSDAADGSPARRARPPQRNTAAPTGRH